MDRFPGDDPDKNQVIFKSALEFIGAVRAGISWERFCVYAVRFSGAFISLLNSSEEALSFLSSKGISTEYVQNNVRTILKRLHLNRNNDHYLTLALPRSASDEQIRRRWKELMLIYHPDRNCGEDSASCARRINEAYGVLKSPRKKMEYDRKRTEIVETYFTHRRSKAMPINKLRMHPFMSPKMRRMAPTLMIASFIVLSCVVLLVIFLQNRPLLKTYHVSALPLEKGQDNSEDRPVTDPANEDIYNKEENSVATFQGADVREQAINRAGTSSEYSRKGPEEFMTNLETRTLGTRTDISPPSRKPSQAAQGKSMVDISNTTVQKTPTEQIEILPSNAIRQMETSEQKELSLLPETRPSVEQKLTSVETANVLPPLPVSGENRLDLETEVFLFITQYVLAYEEGNIVKFMDLFSKAAVENNNMQYGDIKRFYAKNFEGSRYNYTLRNLKVRKSEEPVIVSGDYSIGKVTDKDEGIRTNGTIRWTLGKENGSLKIIRIDYDRR